MHLVLPAVNEGNLNNYAGRMSVWLNHVWAGGESRGDLNRIISNGERLLAAGQRDAASAEFSRARHLVGGRFQHGSAATLGPLIVDWIQLVCALKSWMNASDEDLAEARWNLFTSSVGTAGDTFTGIQRFLRSELQLGRLGNFMRGCHRVEQGG